MPAGTFLSPSTLVGSPSLAKERKAFDQPMPLWPMIALTGPPSGFHGACGLAREKRCTVALVLAMSRVVTSTSLCASDSGAGHVCAKAGNDVRTRAERASGNRGIRAV